MTSAPSSREERHTGAESSALADLLARVRAASAPDREIDFLIARLFRDVPEHVVADVGTPYGWFRRSGEFTLWRTKESDPHAGVDLWKPQAVTASLDAALALVERVLPGWTVQLWISERTSACCVTDTLGYDGPTCAAPTPALALLAALLTALTDASHQPSPQQLEDAPGMERT